MRRQAMTDGRPFGEQLRVWRAAAGLTQVALAERCGVDHTYVSKLEHGRSPAPSLALLRSFAASLGVTFDAMCRAAGRVPDEMTRAELERDWWSLRGLVEAALTFRDARVRYGTTEVHHRAEDWQAFDRAFDDVEWQEPADQAARRMETEA